MNSHLMAFLPFASGCFLAFLLCVTAASPRFGIPVMLAGLKTGNRPENRRIIPAAFILAAVIAQIIIHRRLVLILTTDFHGTFSAVTHWAKMGETLGILLGSFRILSERKPFDKSAV